MSASSCTSSKRERWGRFSKSCNLLLTEIVRDDEEKTKAGKAKMTNAEKQTYRTQRKEQIGEAKKLEDVV